MNKKLILNLVKFVIFGLLFALSFIFLSNQFADSGTSPELGMEERISFAYRGEDKDSVDVVFFGNSDAYRGISPGDLYQEQKITSVVCGAPKADLKTVNASIQDMLLYQKPKVVVIEADCFYSDGKYAAQRFAKKLKLKKSKSADLKERARQKAAAEQRAKKHNVVVRKFKVVQRAVKSGDDALLAGLNYQFPLVKYHNNWKTYHPSRIFTGNPDLYRFSNKGMVFSDAIKPFNDTIDDYMARKRHGITRLTPEGKKYLKEIQENCKRNNIQLVLMTIPSASSWSYLKSDEITKWAKKNNVKFYDYNMQYPEGFDWKYHTKDAGNHLNYQGACLMTSDFGKVLVKDFHLQKSQLTKSQANRWEADYRKFHKKFHVKL